ncbi:MAG TPA: ZIP family metal transporter [Methylomirabilota bacterium]|nr:ZIP family metal transporter [Methylomirabilota bacterium]
MQTFSEFHPLLQALLAGTFTWAVTAVGAVLVFFTREFNRKVLDGMQGFASGVMIAASYWSLLSPAVEMAEADGTRGWIPASIGFLAGGVFLFVCDKLLPHLRQGIGFRTEGISTNWNRTVLLVLAITLHNIPEGMAVGVAFGAVTEGYPSATLPAAMALAFGIGLQNFPEGLAISLPLRREGVPVAKCFWYGQASALVEPAAAVLGAAAVFLARPLLPYAMSFAAGAMIYVVVDELIPDSHRSENHDFATLSTLAGFAVMMLLDVAFG